MSQGHLDPASTRTIVLPTILTSFIGRQQQLDDLAHLLGKSRLVTLTGAAGCGKTRLALEYGRKSHTHFPDGIYWVELARIEHLQLVPHAIAHSLQLSESSDHPLLARMSHSLQDKHLLLILDNCEHVREACASAVIHLLATTSIQIITTSREPLGVTGEIRYPVTPMGIPSSGCTLDDCARSESVQLLVTRGQSILPRFGLTAANADGIVQICQHLDGIPLAIELAAARLNVLTVNQLAARLANSLTVLGSATHLTHSYHQTLHAAIGWSYDLLSMSEQYLLQLLSMFIGGCTLKTAELLTADASLFPSTVLDLLSSLVNKSLVVAETLQEHEARYTLLQMIRQYAHEKLTQSAQWSAIRERYLDCYLYLTEDARNNYGPTNQERWFGWLETEHDNIRLALDWALKTRHIETGLRIYNAVYPFWETRGYWHEARGWFEQLFPLIDNTIILDVRVNALTIGSYFAMFLGDVGQAITWSQIAVSLVESEASDNLILLTTALTGAAGATRAAGDIEAVYQLNTRIMALQRETANWVEYGISLYIQGITTILLGQYDLASELLDRAVVYTRRDKDTYRTAQVLNTKGDLARCLRQYNLAIIYYDESIMLFRTVLATRDIARTMCSLAFAHLRVGNLAIAHRLLTESLASSGAHQDETGTIRALLGLAGLAATLQLYPISVRLQAFITYFRQNLVVVLDSVDEADKFEYDHYSSLVAEHFSLSDLIAEQTRGQVLSLEQAVVLAHSFSLPTTDDNTLSILTRREQEIAYFIGQGLNNSDIADRLILSKRTVEKHIANILDKLGFQNRAQIVRWIITSSAEHGNKSFNEQ